MTHEAQPVHNGPTFLARTRKAVAGGIAGLATGGIGTAITSAVSDGTVTGAEGWQIVTIAIGGFLVGFGAVFLAPANATTEG
jgi:hypothetical protein